MRIRNIERTILAAEEASRRKSLDLLAFADVETLADVDEGRHRWIQRAQCACDHRAQVRAGDRLRRRVPGMPMKLVPRMEDEAQIPGGVSSDQRAAVDDAANSLQTLSELYLIHRCINLRKGAQHVARLDAFLECGVALGIESFCVRHAPGHPQHNDSICARLYFFLGFG